MGHVSYSDIGAGIRAGIERGNECGSGNGCAGGGQRWVALPHDLSRRSRALCSRFRGDPQMILRMSSLFLRTLRDDPADAEVPSHRLLVRAGYIRRAAPGIYSWLPLGLRVLRNIERI